MGTKIKWETAENMMNIVAFTACQSFIENDEEIDLEAIQDFARSTFKDYCEAMGITDVEEPEDEDEDKDEDDFDSDFDFEDEDENEDEDEDEDADEDEDEDEDTTVYSLTPKGYFVLALLDFGLTWEHACEIADRVFIDEDKDE